MHQNRYLPNSQPFKLISYVIVYGLFQEIASVIKNLVYRSPLKNGIIVYAIYEIQNNSHKKS